MSDKNVPTEQWSKRFPARTATILHGTAQKEPHAQSQVPRTVAIAESAHLSTQSALTMPPTVYGNLSKQHIRGSSCAAARLQTPLVANHNLTLTSLPSSSPSSFPFANPVVCSIGAVSTAHTLTSNVPVSSGLLAPIYSIAPVIVNANSYAAVQSPSITNVQTKQQQQLSGTVLSRTEGPLFGVGQLQLENVNVQQQYDLSKLIAVPNFSTVPIINSSPSSAVSASLCTTISSSSSTPFSALCQHHEIQHEQHQKTGAIPSQIAEQLIQTISYSGGDGNGNTSNNGSNINKTSSAFPLHGKLSRLGVRTLNNDKLKSIQHVVESAVSEHAKREIMQILDRISNLRPVEKLLLYLRLPGEMPETDPLRQSQNPLGTRSEINYTINWIRTHLEQDSQVSIPKQGVYNDYLLYCERLDIKPLSTADFGKVMKQVFPGIRPRRLGTRGHSRYCYAAMRKTSKLPAPHLPTIQTDMNSLFEAEEYNNNTNKNNTSHSNNSAIESFDNVKFWPIIKQWAENLLHVKFENITDLASHVKHNVLNIKTVTPSIENTTSATIATVVAITTTTTTAGSVTHKKYQQEKRLLADLGPLKKRRKKKRKGSSSSSESSYNNNNQQQKQLLSPSNSSKQSNEKALLSPPVSNVFADDDEKLIKIKQEVIDSPSIYAQSLKHQESIIDHASGALPMILQQSQQSEIKPMNLISESRNAITALNDSTVVLQQKQLVSSTNAFEHIHQSHEQACLTTRGSASVAAIKNLTPKILELASTTAVTSTPATVLIENESINVLPSPTRIKEEEINDDYSTMNIFCKKVLKAQQTKGFWINSPKSSTISISGNNTLTTASTVTASSSSTYMNLPIVNNTGNTLPSTGSGAGIMSASPRINTPIIGNFSMGPPSSQMAPSSSFSTNTAIAPSPVNLNINYNQLEDSATTPIAAHAKVISRNFQQLRAKKLMLATAISTVATTITVSTTPTTVTSTCDPSDLSVVKDADLPENLGLPRERVISICNMDKHELDDYFLPVEEENSEDQETELLQYFQMGDAEEKTHSNKNLSSNHINNDAATSMKISNNNNTNNPTVIIQTSTSNQGVTNIPLTISMMTINNSKDATIQLTNDNKCNINQILSTTATTILKNTSNHTLQEHAVAYNGNEKSLYLPATSSLSTVGIASASLTQLTQKHQQQQKLKQEYVKENETTTAISSLKRKVSVNSSTAKQDITAARKNYSFLPISPNINTTPPNSTFSITCGDVGLNKNGSFFTSPNITARTLIKQHSMDCDSSDPMIGSGCRKRSYYNVTSASAPPSPSVLKQQQQQACQSLLMGPIPWSTLSDTVCSDNVTYNCNKTSSPPISSGNTSLCTSILNDQNSLDLDLYCETTTLKANGKTSPTLMSISTATNTCWNHSLNITENDVFATLNEVTQRSQSVPLSQLQRSLSPNFKRCFQIGAKLEVDSRTTNNPLCGYSACFSHKQTPVPPDFGDSKTTLSENSCCSQQNATIKLEEVGGVVASDTTVILDEVDVSEILSSPDFAMKISNLTKSNAAITTCSSVGSSSGYSSSGSGYGSSSSGNFTSSKNYTISSGGRCGSTNVCNNTKGISAAVSRSVPSTPLPHHNHHYHHDYSHNMFHNFKRCRNSNYEAYNRINLRDGNRFDHIIGMMENHHHHYQHNSRNNYNICRGNIVSAYDISKSMPATPITITPCNNSFRYSPTDITTDFLINGNAIEESFNSSFDSGNANTSSVINGCNDGASLDTEHVIINSNVIANYDNDDFISNNDNGKINNIASNDDKVLSVFSTTQSIISDGDSPLMHNASVVDIQPLTSVDILDNL